MPKFKQEALTSPLREIGKAELPSAHLLGVLESLARTTLLLPQKSSPFSACFTSNQLLVEHRCAATSTTTLLPCTEGSDTSGARGAPGAPRAQQAACTNSSFQLETPGAVLAQHQPVITTASSDARSPGVPHGTAPPAPHAAPKWLTPFQAGGEADRHSPTLLFI